MSRFFTANGLIFSENDMAHSKHYSDGFSVDYEES